MSLIDDWLEPCSEAGVQQVRLLDEHDEPHGIIWLCSRHAELFRVLVGPGNIKIQLMTELPRTLPDRVTPLM